MLKTPPNWEVTDNYTTFAKNNKASMAKNKYYVVWKGVAPGVYDNWADCKAQVEGQDGAKYKSFETEEEASPPTKKATCTT